MTREQVEATPGFSWPIMYARVLWMSDAPDKSGVYSTRMVVGHSVLPDDPDVALLYDTRKPRPARTLLVQFEGGKVKHVRYVRFVR